MPSTVLDVRVGDGRYGFDVADVTEVVRAVAVVSLPSLPSVVDGVIDYRGRVIPVIHLRRRFHFDAAEPNLTDRFVIARSREMTVALRVDEVVGVVEVEQGEIEAAEEIWAAGVRIAGAVRVVDAMILIADMDAFLSETEVLAVEAALTDAAPPHAPKTGGG